MRKKKCLFYVSLFVCIGEGGGKGEGVGKGEGGGKGEGVVQR